MPATPAAPLVTRLPSATRRQQGTRRPPTVTRVPGLDGIRALAVAAVLVYHAYPGWLPGGFLGVDVFFVVSGFLITRRLLTGIRLRDFYAGRARRLLPALGALVAGVALAGLTVWRTQPALGSDLLASLGYATNWWFVARHHSYFLTAGPPSPVQHLWSLAIEEQFYLLWPVGLLFLAGLVRPGTAGRRRGPGRRPAAGTDLVALVALGGALASTAVMAALAVLDDVPYRTDSSRLYFGTDTHAMGLLLGAALAAAAAGHGHLLRRVRPWFAEIAGALALLGLLGCFALVDEYRPGLYRGGFLGVSAVAAVLVLACTHPTGLAGPALDVGPLRWLGRRSYEVYLWHWPVFLLIGGGAETTGGVAAARLPLQLLVTAVLAALTHRYLTEPIWHGRPVARRRWARPGLVAATAAAALAALLLVRPPAAPVSTLAGSTVDAPGVATSPSASAPPARAGAPAPVAPSAPPASPAPPVAPPGTPPGQVGGVVSAFGDSVLLGAAPALRTVMPGLSLHATVGIQAAVVFRQVRAAGAGLGPIVLIHTGNNGVVSRSDLDRLLTQLAGEQLVVVVNDHLPRSWQGPNNRTFAAVVPGHANAVLVDWYGAANGHPEWFTPDRVHLRPAGARAYATLIAGQIAARLAAATNG